MRCRTRARRSAGGWPRPRRRGGCSRGFAETFGLRASPRRIEVYDNSHIMGTNAVGAMVVAGPEGFVKNQYRKFNIRSTEITPGDDFGMMREVMQRRFSRLIKEHERPDSPPSDRRRNADVAEEDDMSQGMPAWPDVILIDGGQGQMSAVRVDPRRARHIERSHGDRHRQGRRSRGRARALLRAGPRRRSRCRCATRCCISSSGCATRRTASPSARTAPGARRR